MFEENVVSSAGHDVLHRRRRRSSGASARAGFQGRAPQRALRLAHAAIVKAAHARRPRRLPPHRATRTSLRDAAVVVDDDGAIVDVGAPARCCRATQGAESSACAASSFRGSSTRTRTSSSARCAGRCRRRGVRRRGSSGSSARAPSSARGRATTAIERGGRRARRLRDGGGRRGHQLPRRRARARAPRHRGLRLPRGLRRRARAARASAFAGSKTSSHERVRRVAVRGPRVRARAAHALHDASRRRRGVLARRPRARTRARASTSPSTPPSARPRARRRPDPGVVTSAAASIAAICSSGRAVAAIAFARRRSARSARTSFSFTSPTRAPRSSSSSRAARAPVVLCPRSNLYIEDTPPAAARDARSGHRAGARHRLARVERVARRPRRGARARRPFPDRARAGARADGDVERRARARPRRPRAHRARRAARPRRRSTATCRATIDPCAFAPGERASAAAGSCVVNESLPMQRRSRASARTARSSPSRTRSSRCRSRRAPSCSRSRVPHVPLDARWRVVGDARVHGRARGRAPWRSTAGPTATSTRRTRARRSRHVPSGRVRAGEALALDDRSRRASSSRARRRSASGPRSSRRSCSRCSSATRTQSASRGPRTRGSAWRCALAPGGAWIAMGASPTAGIVAAHGRRRDLALGFDVLYSLQDETFDREHGLHSDSRRASGGRRALAISAAAHVVTAVASSLSLESSCIAAAPDFVAVAVVDGAPRLRALARRQGEPRANRQGVLRRQRVGERRLLRAGPRRRN